MDFLELIWIVERMVRVFNMQATANRLPKRRWKASNKCVVLVDRADTLFIDEELGDGLKAKVVFGEVCERPDAKALTLSYQQIEVAHVVAVISVGIAVQKCLLEVVKGLSHIAVLGYGFPEICKLGADIADSIGLLFRVRSDIASRKQNLKLGEEARELVGACGVEGRCAAIAFERHERRGLGHSGQREKRQWQMEGCGWLNRGL